MMEKKWTKAQQEAITARGKNLLVAAAAGSGKTAVLVERVIQQILDGSCDVDHLLVLTFTKAAAAEMKERIESALEERLDAANDDALIQRLERQLVLLSNASIATFDSFCGGILREHFDDVDIDPKFRIASEQELLLIKEDVLEDVLEAEYEAGEEAFLALTDAFGDDKGDEELSAIIKTLHNFSTTQPFPEAWLLAQAEPYEEAASGNVEALPWFQELNRGTARTIEEISEGLEEFVQFSAANGLTKYEEIGRLDVAAFEAVREQKDWARLQAGFQKFKLQALRANPKGVDADAVEEAKAQRDRIKERVVQLQKTVFFASKEELVESLHLAAPLVRELCRVTLRFAEAFRGAKREKRIADFSDMEHFAIDVLSEKVNGVLKPSAVAEELREKYHAIMVDEYQDTNGVQETIISLIRRADNLFTVGDVKQSIYRFRSADPSIFMEKYDRYSVWQEDKIPPTADERVDLKMNFRSRASVLAAINGIFVPLMGKEGMEIAYDEAARLYAGAKDYAMGEDTLEGAAEFHVIVQDEDFKELAGTEEAADKMGEADEMKAAEREAQHIADEIKKLMTSGKMVMRGGKKEKLAYRDIVILIRSMKNVGNVYLEVLRDNNIPAYAGTSGGYFEEMEVRVVLALLAVLDNARQDVPLAAVLLSPIGGMKAAELAELRAKTPEGNILDALLRAGSVQGELSKVLVEKAGSFLARLAHWRDLARELRVPDLLHRLYEETGYYEYAGALPGGLLRQANLRMLVTRAAQYEQTDFRGLFRFLRFIERMKKNETDLDVARTLSESEDVVRIVTIHKSKGLEFPVVFLASLGKEFNTQELKEPVLMDGTLGVGVPCITNAGCLRVPTIAHHALKAKKLRELKAEELRLLYVAVTRAKEKLILVGTCGKKKFKSFLAYWCRMTGEMNAPLPAAYVQEGKSLLHWVGAAVAHHADGAPIRAAAGMDTCVPFLGYTEKSHWDVHLIPASEIHSAIPTSREEDAILTAMKKGARMEDSEAKDEVLALLTWQYAARNLGNIPAKLTVTELKRRMAEKDPMARSFVVDSLEWKVPNFLAEEKRERGAGFGTLMHAVFEQLDFNLTGEKKAVQTFLKKLVECGRLTKEEEAQVNCKMVQDFLRSPMAARIKAAKNVQREVPFSKLFPASEFYAEAEEGKIFVQGVMDIFFEDAEGKCVLLDYKTDWNITAEEAKRRYALQLGIYARAAEEIFDRAVDEKYLYLLRTGEVVAV